MKKNRLIVYQAIKPCTLNTANNRETIPHKCQPENVEECPNGAINTLHFVPSRSTKHFSNQYYLPRISTTC